MRPNCDFRFLQHRPPPLWPLPWFLFSALHHIVSRTTVVDETTTCLSSHGPHPMSPRTIELLHRPRLGIAGTLDLVLPCLRDIQLHRPSLGLVPTSGIVKFVVSPGTLIDNAIMFPPRYLQLFHQLLPEFRAQSSLHNMPTLRPLLSYW